MGTSTDWKYEQGLIYVSFTYSHHSYSVLASLLQFSYTYTSADAVWLVGSGRNWRRGDANELKISFEFISHRTRVLNEYNPECWQGGALTGVRGEKRKGGRQRVTSSSHSFGCHTLVTALPFWASLYEFKKISKLIIGLLIQMDCQYGEATCRAPELHPFAIFGKSIWRYHVNWFSQWFLRRAEFWRRQAASF